MSGLIIQNYGQKREVNCTDGEQRIFDIIQGITNINELELVRKSDSYVTAEYGEWDVARFKFTDRAKWIRLPHIDIGSAKHPIKSPEDVYDFKQVLLDTIEHIQKYQK